MSKVGRNDDCPCGSKLKYKRCHGSVLKSTSSIESNIPLDATKQRVSVGGFPGTYQSLHQLYRFKGDDPRNSLPLEGSPGLYEVTFILHRPGYSLQPEGHLTFSSGLRGDSHLAIAKPAYSPPGSPDADQIRIMGHTEDGNFEFIGLPNAKGFLGKLVTLPFAAKNRGHAEELAYRAIASSLSNMSLHLDIPLEIGHRETKELSNGSIQISFVSPYLEAPMAINATANFMPEFRSYAALYREALNTKSPVFEFLCLFKIIESLRGRRTRLSRAAKKNNQPFILPSEVLPRTNVEIKVWLEALFYIRREFDLSTFDSAVPADLRGRTVNDVFDDVLNPLRVKVAHALFGTGGELPLSSDDLLHTHAVTQRLLVTKCIVRRMLKNDFPSDFLNHLPG
jgi:hypothetical protein